MARARLRPAREIGGETLDAVQAMVNPGAQIAACGMLEGESIGKRLVQIAADPTRF